MKTEIVSIDLMIEEDVREMFDLHSRYFSNISFDTFISDFKKKNYVIRLYDEKKLAGFSTVKTVEIPVNKIPATFIYSGDTVIDRKYWNNNGTLAGAFGHIMLRMIESDRDKKDSAGVFWFLISKGCRTFRFLPVFFKEFYPDPLGMEKSLRLKPILQQVASRFFGKEYDPNTNILSYSVQKDYLKRDIAEIPERRKKDPYIKFFLEKNPFYTKGDEMACLAPVAKDNLKPSALRVIKNTQVVWNE